MPNGARDDALLAYLDALDAHVVDPGDHAKYAAWRVARLDLVEALEPDRFRRRLDVNYAAAA